MESSALFSLAAILIFGITAQWLAWRLKLPSILLLLLFGVVAGPVAHIVDPASFGEIITPFISLSVAVILYEGGLSLRLRELKQVGSAVINLITIGVLVTWVVVALAAWLFLDFSLELSLLFGAILTVTGPTVIIPLLRQVRPTGPVGSILKWEGILVDPIGAMLTVLVLEIITVHGGQPTVGLMVAGVLKMLGVGIGIGLVGAGALLLLLKHYQVPDYLQNPVSLMLVVAVYTGAQHLQPESGLFATTVMGLALANQRLVPVVHIVEFKENLRVLLISSLFILLAAQLDLNGFRTLTVGSIGFLLVLMLVARPLAVWMSTLKSPLSWREKAFLAWMAPRGIVAAAVTSVAATRLLEQGYAGAERLVPLIFLVIIVTVSVYGLSAFPLSHWLKVASASPQGLLFVGAHGWARLIAKALHDAGVRVLLVDTNLENVVQAQREGMRAHCANILSDDLDEMISLDGIGRLVALTSNDEVNLLAGQRFVHAFGRAELYHLATRRASHLRDSGISLELHGRILGDADTSFPAMQALFDRGAELMAVQVPATTEGKVSPEAVLEMRVPLFTISETGVVTVHSADTRFTPKPGQMVIGIVEPAVVRQEHG